MARSLKWWQWETLLVTMGGYALYYVIRKNLSIAMPLLGDIGVSKVQLGAFLTCGGIVYGVGRFLNGIVADRNSARKVMAIGLFICSFVNVLFGLSDWIVEAAGMGARRPTGGRCGRVAVPGDRIGCPRLDDGGHMDREPVFPGDGRGAMHQDAPQVVPAGGAFH